MAKDKEKGKKRKAKKSKKKANAEKIQKLVGTPIPFQQAKPTLDHFTPSILKNKKPSSIVKTPSFLQKNQEPSEVMGKKEVAPTETSPKEGTPAIMKEFQDFLTDIKSTMLGTPEEIESEKATVAQVPIEAAVKESSPAENAQKVIPGRPLNEFMDFLSDATGTMMGDNSESKSAKSTPDLIEHEVPVPGPAISEDLPGIESPIIEDPAMIEPVKEPTRAANSLKNEESSNKELSLEEKKALAAEFGNFLSNVKKKMHGDDE